MPDPKFWKLPLDWMCERIPSRILRFEDTALQWFIFIVILALIGGCCVEVFTP